MLFRSYEPLPNAAGAFRRSISRRVFDAAASLLRAGPVKGLSRQIIRPDVLEPDATLGLPPDNHIAFRKMEDDRLGDGSQGTRAWNQHVDF